MLMQLITSKVTSSFTVTFRQEEFFAGSEITSRGLPGDSVKFGEKDLSVWALGIQHELTLLVDDTVG